MSQIESLISPGRGENKKNWNHHLVYHVCRDFGDFDASMVYFTMGKDHAIQHTAVAAQVSF